MLTAGFNHRGQTLLHFGTIGLGPKSKPWILYSAERTQPGIYVPAKPGPIRRSTSRQAQPDRQLATIHFGRLDRASDGTDGA